MNQKRLIGFILGGGRSVVKGGGIDWQLWKYALCMDG